MARIVSGYDLYQACKDEGFDLPAECADVEMRMPVDGVIQLAYIVNLDEESLAAFGRALIRMAQKAAEARLPPREPDLLR